MTLILKQLFTFLKMINSETGTNELAAGMSCGLILGFSPILSLQAFLILMICFFFRIQLGAAIFAAFFFKFIAYLFDPISDALGRLVLESQVLRPLFISLYNMPLVPLTRFNNSIVMGSAVVGFVLLLPMFFVFRRLIHKYREVVVARIKGSKLWKLMQATSLFKWYSTYDKLYG